MGTSVEEWDPEALAGAHGDVHAHLSRGSEHGQGQQVGGRSHQGLPGARVSRLE